MLEQPHKTLANHRPVSGYPTTQQTPPPRSLVQGPGQPTYYHFDPSGRPFMHPLPPQYPFPPFPHPVPVFSQVHGPTGHVVGLVRRGSFSLPGRTDAGPGLPHVPPGWAQPQTYQPSGYPRMQPQVHPQMQPQRIPQVPPQFHHQIPPHPMPMNWGAPPGPPPPYQGPLLTSGGPTPGTYQTDPSTGRRDPRTSGTFAIPQSQTLRMDPNDRTEHDGSGLNVPPVPARGKVGNGPTRANPPRKARPKDLSELE
jgi:hypothetical protein